VRAQLTLFLPDEDVGAILGRKGQNLVDIQQVRVPQCLTVWWLCTGWCPGFKRCPGCLWATCAYGQLVGIKQVHAHGARIASHRLCISG